MSNGLRNRVHHGLNASARSAFYAKDVCKGPVSLCKENKQSKVGNKRSLQETLGSLHIRLNLTSRIFY